MVLARQDCVKKPKEATFGKLQLDHLWMILVFATLVVFNNTHPLRPHDFWWHLRAGQEIVTSGSIPTVDTFSYTMAGTPYDNYAAFWLMEVLYYLIFKLGGPALIILLNTTMITLAYGAVLYLCWAESRSWRLAAGATFFAIALGFDNWNVRPQSVSFLAGSVILTTIYRYRVRPRTWLLALAPFSILVWANAHGSFVIGLIMLAAWAADEAMALFRKKPQGTGRDKARSFLAAVLTLAVSSGVPLLNPRGFGIFGYVVNLSSNPVIKTMVAEWAAPTFADRHGAIFLVCLLLTSTLLAVSPKRPSFFQILTYLGFGMLALKTSRAIVWFGIVMAPIVAAHLRALIGTNQASQGTIAGREGVQFLNWIFAGIIAALVILSLPWFKQLLPLPTKKAGLVSSETPVAATEFLLRHRLPGPVFNDQVFGSYLIWAAHPAYQVFIDTRLELYPMTIWHDYFTISSGQAGWQEALDRYGIHTLMLSPSAQRELIAAASKSVAWQLIYEDNAAVIFIRMKLGEVGT